MEAKIVHAHIRIFPPSGGWVTAHITDTPERIAEALSPLKAEYSYTDSGREYREETPLYAAVG